MDAAVNTAADAAARTDAMRGETLWRPGEQLFRWLDRGVQRHLPAALNPLAHTGAMTTVSFIIATVSGIVLLVWYSSSVHSAWDSVQAMDARPWTAGLVRSVHRYSSDACMLFALVHAFRLFFAGRFTGPKWLSWVTGILMLGALWLVGWLGYWLVWDTRAQQIAVGSARFLDYLPIFADPPSRGFLADATVNSLLFFVVFFAHMLLPMAMAVLIWLHIARLARSEFLTNRSMTWALMAALVAVSIAVPADLAPRAEMTAVPDPFLMDFWYLATLWITDRTSAGFGWMLALASFAILVSIPWSLRVRRRPAPAVVDIPRCNSCYTCSKDCPYEAITMVPRTDGRNYTHQAQVDPARCTACGVCAGSCDSIGIGIPDLPVMAQRKKMDAWLEAAPAGPAPYVAFLCSGSALGAMSVNSATGECDEWPGWRVQPVPCSGWIHMMTIERAFRHGAKGVAIIDCGCGDCHAREGAGWMRERLEGQRDPKLDTAKAPPDRIMVLDAGTLSRSAIRQALSDFQVGGTSLADRSSAPWRLRLAAAVLAAILSLITVLPSRVTYAVPSMPGSQLVISFRHPGRAEENCRDLTPEEKAQRPAHMQVARVCDRTRASVRLRVLLDGRELITQAYAPGGIWGDGPSIAVETLPVETGRRHVEIAIGDSHDPGEWTYLDSRDVTFETGRRAVALFDRTTGFTWH